ncbi:hypothetical protein DOTSEDRAFT_53547 [Dothistroma septosporum NZE10]|uniref:F-box domain-containing protein n=1 Tax=Dothistroma septosporum (strain NZE10 / CBS 128990) TaxID=675120 RepID=N1PM70_DOTSN|nr:hypothetical protein DOTSEDRAFT_53547 [Dothistroma septosporum NZE10]
MEETHGARSGDDETAQQQVFRDAKLLEAILVHVDDVQTLFLSQRVNTTFRECITNSCLLRQLLWLDPDPRIQMWHLGRLNPLLSRSVSRKKHKHILSLTHSGCDVCILTTMNAQDLQVTGSWRNMLVYQPHSPFAVFKTADCWASSESFRQDIFKDPPKAGKLVESSISRSRNSPGHPLTQRPHECDRRFGHNVHVAGNVLGRAKVLVP